MSKSIAEELAELEKLDLRGSRPLSSGHLGGLTVLKYEPNRRDRHYFVGATFVPAKVAKILKDQHG